MTPFIVTFYSYKGGVGRSLLAANIGVLSARRGKTLLWDLDIEAPGLHNIPGLTPAKSVRKGFFEWMISWQESGVASDKADFSKLVKLVCQTPEQDRLFILPAYGDNKDFAGLFQSIRWDDFLVRDLDSGLALFRGILDAFGKAGFETVLLDSRTGITDIGGLLAALLPHATVLVGNYGRQNTKGLAHVWQALRPASEGRIAPRGALPPLTRLLVASPIADDVDLRTRGEAIWKESFGLAPAELVTIPFDSRLLFTEELYASTRPDSPVGKAYNDLERRIDKVRQQVIAESESARRSDDARPELVSRRREDRLEQGKSFEERVAHLLRLLGYSVEREQLIDSNRVDLVARKRADFGREELYFVECKDHQAVVPKETMQVFKTWLEGPTAREMQARGMVVAARDFSPAARGYAREQGIQALTYDELERSLFDFSPYLARIRQRYEASALASTYVDQYLLLEKQPDEKSVPMLPHALEWVSGAGSRLWLVLGDYGTGKSTLVERLAYELACTFANNPDTPVPVAINLRNFPNAISLESLIREHLETELRTVLNPEIVLHLLEAGRVVLLLDSFDEMGVAQAGRSVEEQFRLLARPTANPGRNPRGNRVLITSRSHFFRDTKSAMQAVQGGDRLFEADSALGKAARAFDATLDTLPVFTKEQIAEYLQKRLGMVEGDEARRFIEERYGLQDIASTPQLLDMIVASLPDLLKQGEKVTTGSLYLTYTTRWLNTIRLSQGEVNVEHMRDLLERMACELWSRPRNQIHYTDLAVLLHHEGGLARSLDSERVDLELRTASFLVRSADGYYRFSHRSFLEFFFARALFRALQEGYFAKALAYGRVNPEATTFMLDLTESAHENSDKLTGTIRTILANPYAEITSENALLIAYRAAHYRFQAIPIEQRSRQRLLAPEQIPLAQKQMIPPKANLKGAQLAGENLTLLCADEIDFSNADLRGTTFSSAILDKAGFDGARIDDALLDNASIAGATLVGTSALRIKGRHLDMNHAKCSDACFDGADLRNLQASNADFSSARMRLTRLAEAWLDNANLATADLTGATWPRADGFASNSGLLPVNPRIAGLIGHAGELNACAFSPDGKWILTAGSDSTARLWERESGKEIRRFEGHSGWILACAFSPDGKWILTAGS
ncbi:MAG: restriction endonuclease, partial [Chlorobium sp.]